MLDFARILAPVDFSDRSAAGARYAGSLAYRLRAELVLLHVIESPLGVREMLTPELQAERGEKLDRFLAGELQGVNVRRILSSGDPASEIAATANEHRAGLIVMPTHGYGPVRRFLLGSVTAKVLHDSSRPVLTGWRFEKNISPRLRLSTVMCALDLGPGSTEFLEWAGAFALKAGARLAVAHFVCTPPCGAYVNPEWAERAERQSVSCIEMLLENQGLHAQIVVSVEKTPDQGIAKVARRLHADLVVVGRRGDYGAGGRLPTHSYSLVRESPCPVVTV